MKKRNFNLLLTILLLLGVLENSDIALASSNENLVLEKMETNLIENFSYSGGEDTIIEDIEDPKVSIQKKDLPQLINVNQTYYMTIDEYTSNRYYIEFNIPQDGYIKIDLRRLYASNGREGHWDFTLKDLHGNEYLSTSTEYEDLLSYDNSNYIQHIIGLKAGTYRYEINPSFSVNSGTWNLDFRINFTATNFFEKENNDNTMSATTLIPNIMYEAIAGEGAWLDEDYFKFELSKKGNYKLKTSYNWNSDMYFFIYDSNLNLIGVLSSNDMKIEGDYYTYLFEDSIPGMYYIKVSSLVNKTKYKIGIQDTNFKSGWTQVNGKYYFINSDSSLHIGWKNINNKWYFFDELGVMQTDWKQIGQQWYYFNRSGIMQTGWLKQNSRYYYLNNSGAMQTGWLNLNGIWYYLNKDGIMSTNWEKIGQKWYYFNQSGIMQTGWLKQGNKYYYLNKSGAMLVGHQKVGTKQYYFNQSGVMQTGWLNLNNKWYYFNQSGVMQTGWLNLNNKWYFLDKDGVMVIGTQFIGGKWYEFDGSGAMQ